MPLSVAAEMSHWHWSKHKSGILSQTDQKETQYGAEHRERGMGDKSMIHTTPVDGILTTTCTTHGAAALGSQRINLPAGAGLVIRARLIRPISEQCGDPNTPTALHTDMRTPRTPPEYPAGGLKREQGRCEHQRPDPASGEPRSRTAAGPLCLDVLNLTCRGLRLWWPTTRRGR